MYETKNGRLTPISKTLRKNMTPQEKKLWYRFLKKLPVTVNRQKVIGDFVVDFYIASASLVIELDGSGHRTEAGREADAIRDARLAENGLTVLRLSNRSINENFSAACRRIREFLPDDIQKEE